MNNKVLIKIIKIFAFIVITAAVMTYISYVLERKASNYANKAIYDEVSDIDVIFAGSSHIMNSVIPYYLWQEYGITSYNAGVSGQTIELSYFALREIFKKKTPKYLVLDISKPQNYSDGKLHVSNGNIHRTIDFIPINSDKIEIARLAATTKDESVLSYLSNFYSFHERWKELKEKDFLHEYNCEKGSRIKLGVYPIEKLEIFESGTMVDVQGLDEYKYIMKILDLCNEKSITPVIVNIPYTEETKEKQDLIHSIMLDIEDQGYCTINLLDNIEGIGIDSLMDFADSDHVNSIGAKKISSYVGGFLVDKFDITDKRNFSEYGDWDEFSDFYEKYMLQRAMDENKALYILQLLYGIDGYEEKIIAKDDKIIEDDELSKFIEYAKIEVDGKNCEMTDFDNIDTDQIGIAVFDKYTGELVGSKIVDYCKEIYKIETEIINEED